MKIATVVGTSKPDQVDVEFTNAQGATITLGYPVCFTTTAASVDGRLAVLPAASNLRTFGGVALSDVPDNGNGKARIFGVVNSVAIFATGTSVTTAIDVAMGPGAASLGVNSTGLLESFGPVVSLEAIGAAINSPGGYAKGFVRAL